MVATEAVSLLISYKYIILIPLAILEGPIVAVFAGFLSSIGVLNGFLVYIICVGADFIGDTFWYSLGRWGSGLINRFGSKIGLTDNKLSGAKKYFDKNYVRVLIFGKLFHGVGVAGLIAAGDMKFPYGKYGRTCIIVSFFQSGIFMIIGFLFGHSYVRIAQYADYFGLFASIITVIVGFFVYRAIKRKALME
jgi:membrane protein DedA with SNARE-associated domain